MKSAASLPSERRSFAKEQTPPTATRQTSAGLGPILKLSNHCALLFSGGRTWIDQRSSYHFYAALGLNFGRDCHTNAASVPAPSQFLQKK
jgi:hypothetical protein